MRSFGDLRLKLIEFDTSRIYECERVHPHLSLQDRSASIPNFRFHIMGYYCAQ